MGIGTKVALGDSRDAPERVNDFETVQC
jgi:hypothetical protein